MQGEQTLHRRKSSKDEDENLIILTPPPPSSESTHASHSPSFSEFSSQAHPINASSAHSPRTRTQSTPLGYNRIAPASVVANGNPLSPTIGVGGSPQRPTFNISRPGHANVNATSNGLPPSPYRSSFSSLPPPPHPKNLSMNVHGHSRTRSISSPFSPTQPSPLSSSYHSTHTSSQGITPSNTYHHPTASLSTLASSSFLTASPTMYTFPSSSPTPESQDFPSNAKSNQRRHSRIHSRNLSIFFPRPGSLPHSVISEDGDGGQEIEIQAHVDEEAPIISVPSAGSSVEFRGSNKFHHNPKHDPITPLGQGFTFGSKPPPLIGDNNGSSVLGRGSSSTMGTTRRGHHHKHSLSHNFFSFLEPGSLQQQTPTTADGSLAAPNPVSPWSSTSSLLPNGSQNDDRDSVHRTGTPSSYASSSPSPHVHNHKHPYSSSTLEPQATIPILPSLACIIQFILGAWLWVRGQQVGSLAVTGLGYWVVFDSFGVGLTAVMPSWLEISMRSMKTFGDMEKFSLRRPYGNARLETVCMFAQTVYLMFSSVYVCKEAVEHILLSMGGHAEGEGGHHHHHVDEDGGLPMNFPIVMTMITLITIIGNAAFFDNHSKLVNVTRNRLPSVSAWIRSLSTPSAIGQPHTQPSTRVAMILSNPYIMSPILFCSAILAVALILPSEQHSPADLVLAFVIAVITFNLAYRACVVIGAVLLQTSPPRGLPNGKMEAFLRVMREVERHPQVLHLPAPHIWQVAPASASSGMGSSITDSGGKIYSNSQKETLVVTMELHVRPDLGDDDVLLLTKWAWEKCVNALGGSTSRGIYGKVKEDRGDGMGGPDVTVGVVRG